MLKFYRFQITHLQRFWACFPAPIFLTSNDFRQNILHASTKQEYLINTIKAVFSNYIFYVQLLIIAIVTKEIRTYTYEWPHMVNHFSNLDNQNAFCQYYDIVSIFQQIPINMQYLHYKEKPPRESIVLECLERQLSAVAQLRSSSQSRDSWQRCRTVGASANISTYLSIKY